MSVEMKTRSLVGGGPLEIAAGLLFQKHKANGGKHHETS